MRRIFRLFAIATVAFIYGVRAFAAPVPVATSPIASATNPAASTLTVAILDFQSDIPGSANLGAQITTTLVATLGGEPGYTLVDRSSLTRVLQELELNRSGLVNTDQAVKVGKLVGAKLLVTGQAFSLDKQILLTAKIIGVETGLVQGVIVKGDRDGDVLPLLLQLGEKLAKKLPEVGPRLIGQDDAPFDPVPALKLKLAGRKLPILAVRVAERHVADTRAARIDPAVETEIRQVLLDCGFKVIDGDESDWTKGSVEMVIDGEAFTELGARIGTLINCTDRVEVKITRFRDKELLLSDRDSNQAVDLSENLAAKSALQKSGRILAIHILQHFDQTLPAVDKKANRKK